MRDDNDNGNNDVNTKQKQHQVAVLWLMALPAMETTTASNSTSYNNAKRCNNQSAQKMTVETWARPSDGSSKTKQQQQQDQAMVVGKTKQWQQQDQATARPSTTAAGNDSTSSRNTIASSSTSNNKVTINTQQLTCSVRDDSHSKIDSNTKQQATIASLAKIATSKHQHSNAGLMAAALWCYWP